MQIVSDIDLVVGVSAGGGVFLRYGITSTSPTGTRWVLLTELHLKRLVIKQIDVYNQKAYAVDDAGNGWETSDIMEANRGMERVFDYLPSPYRSCTS